MGHGIHPELNYPRRPRLTPEQHKEARQIRVNARERVHRRYFPPLEHPTPKEDLEADRILQRALDRVNRIPSQGTIFERIKKRITGK